MKTLLLATLVILFTTQAFCQDFYLDSIYNGNDTEESSKYFYNSDYTIKQIVKENEVLGYDHEDLKNYSIEFYSRINEIYHDWYNIKKDDANRIVQESRYDQKGNLESIFYEDVFIYQNNLLLEHTNNARYELAGQQGFWNNYTEEYTYNEANQILLYEKSSPNYGGITREYLRDVNGTLLQTNLESTEAGHLTIDTSYYNADFNGEGWTSYGYTLRGSEDPDMDCDSTFAFINGDFTRRIKKNADNCIAYDDITYTDTIISSSPVIPYEYLEFGYIDPTSNDAIPWRTSTFTVDSSDIQQGRYIVIETTAGYEIKHFYTQNPDMGEFIVGMEEENPEEVSTIEISPNPVEVGGNINLDLGSNDVDEIKILDHTGALITSVQVLTGSSMISVQAPLEPGIYFITFCFEGMFVDSKKVMVVG